MGSLGVGDIDCKEVENLSFQDRSSLMVEMG
jgi:hypothetical protein